MCARLQLGVGVALHGPPASRVPQGFDMQLESRKTVILSVIIIKVDVDMFW